MKYLFAVSPVEGYEVTEVYIDDVKVEPKTETENGITCIYYTINPITYQISYEVASNEDGAQIAKILDQDGKELQWVNGVRSVEEGSDFAFQVSVADTKYRKMQLVRSSMSK